jgi:predicted AlkP superfamily phosphohydrolase/phosphomutase
MTFDLLHPLFAQDLMPNLQSLYGTGYSSSLLSTVPPISATAWATFITGVNPGRHGILQFVKLRPDQNETDRETNALEVFPGGVSLLNADSIQSSKLWRILGDADKRQVVINVPLTYPPRSIKGTMISGMMTPPSADIFTYPRELSQTLRKQGYEIDLSISEKEFSFDPSRLVSRLHELMSKRRTTAINLMTSESWDLCIVIFTGTDRLQHRFWKHLVPGHPEYASREAARLRPQLEVYFQDLDQAIAQLVAGGGSDATVIVLSDHGFGPVSDRTVHRLSMMQALGLTQDSASSGIVRLRRVVEGRLGMTPDRVRRLVKAALPGSVLSRLEARAREAQLSATAEDPAYSVTLHEYVGGIYINPDHLPPEADSYTSFREEIVSGIKELMDPDTGVSLISSVWRREELYAGPALPQCPDVIFRLAPGYGLSGGVGPGGNLVSPRHGETNKQGTHRDEGILLLNGPHTSVGRGVQQKLLDVTSTILYLLDVPIPVGMDSRPILAAFNEGFVARRPPRYEDVLLDTRVSDTAPPESWIEEEDTELLLARLRSLGYIEEEE